MSDATPTPDREKAKEGEAKMTAVEREAEEPGKGASSYSSELRCSLRS